MKSLAIKNHFKEQSLYVNRVVVLIVAAIFLFVILLARLAYLQIYHHQQYQIKSRNNTVRIHAVAPARGIVFDRSGQILAKNITTYHLEVIPEQVKDMPRILNEVNRFIGLTPRQIELFEKRVKQSPKHASIPLKLKLSEKEAAIISVQLHKLEGVHLRAGLIRHYPMGEIMAHVLGYVGRINPDDLNNLDKKRYSGTHFIGKSGIEKQYESLLQGQPGWQEVETDVRGRQVRALKTTPSHPGTNLTLTIDADLQAKATELLKGEKGAIVAISPQDGEILAMVSAPSFDPNVFVTGMSQDQKNELYSSKNPLFNRFLRGQYPPASTLKPIVSLAALHYNIVKAHETINDPGWYQLNEHSRRIRDWLDHGHGTINMRQAIAQSCDTYIYDLSFKLGIDRLSDWFSYFGFGQSTGIDLPGERYGLVPNRAWKQQTKHEPWYHGETLITGIGQGYLSTTPLQLAQSAMLIANRGVKAQLHLVKGQIKNIQHTSKTQINPAHWQAIIDGMVDTVAHPSGTAYKAFKNTSYSIAGKTGTAQVFGMQEERVKQDALPEHLRDHSLFIGFAPVENPQIAVAIIKENSRGSAEIARALFDHILEPSG